MLLNETFALYKIVALGNMHWNNIASGELICLPQFGGSTGVLKNNLNEEEDWPHDELPQIL